MPVDELNAPPVGAEAEEVRGEPHPIIMQFLDDVVNVEVEQQDRQPPAAAGDAVDQAAVNARKIKILAAGLSGTLTVVWYPFNYARTLMQVGYEPLEPVKSVTLFRRPCLMLPNLWQYVKYIKSVDGFFGCFRGLAPYLLLQTSHRIVFKYCIRFVCNYIAEPGVPNSPYGDQQELEVGAGDRAQRSVFDEDTHQEGEFRTYLRDMGLDLGCKLIAVSATYPLRVITIHSMASFVGREPELSGGVIWIVKEIWKNNGIGGFFNGLAPRLLSEGVTAVSVGLLTYFIKVAVSNEEICYGLQFSTGLLTRAVAYAFETVSSTMALNGGCSTLGNKPFTPTFDNWIDCWNYLRDLNQLRRGSSIMFRYYTGPTISVNGVIRPSLIYFGPNLSKNYVVRAQ